MEGDAALTEPYIYFCISMYVHIYINTGMQSNVVITVQPSDRIGCHMVYYINICTYQYMYMYPCKHIHMPNI